MKHKLGLLFDKLYQDEKKEYIKILEKKLKKNEKTFIVTANPEAFNIALENEQYMDMLMDERTEIIPDGIGLVKAAKILGYDIKEKIPGIDIVENLLMFANQYKKTIYLFGAKQEVIDKMTSLIKNKYPKITIIGAKNGYEKDKDKVFQDIINKEPDIVLVALGMPLQEELIYKYLDKFKKGIFVGVGGSFDVLSGSKKRAPKIFIKLNLEWLYRIVREPKRIKRFYNNNIKFIRKIYKIRNSKK